MTMIDQLPRSTLEAQGIAPAAILGFVEAVERDIHDMHSFMLVRHGAVVAEAWWNPFEPDFPHMLFSLSKSFTATAIGLAVAEGRLSLDDRVLAFFADDAPAEVSEHLAAMRVRHLLAMSTGHSVDTTPALRQSPDGNWARAFLACPVTHAPGTHFLYNTGATYMLSAIIQHLTGATLLEYLQPRVLAPLGIVGATWETCPRGINTGGFGMRAKTEDIARFGQLYLQDGVWEGRQLLPPGWVAEASAVQTDNRPNVNVDWEQGYGYQFWRCRHGAYRGDGAFGQFCIIMPEQDAVIAITSGVGPMQPVLDLVWQHLLPALGAAALPADEAGRAALAQKLAGLAIRPPQGQGAPALAAEVSGRTYNFAANDVRIESIGFSFGADGCAMTIRDERGDHRIGFGDRAWRTGSTLFVDRGLEQPIVAAGAWTGDDTYVARMYYTETPFCVTMTSRFAGERVWFDFALNVAFVPTTFPQIEGRAEAQPS